MHCIAYCSILTTWEIILILKLSSNCVIANSIDIETFETTDTKSYVLVGEWSTRGNAILFKQLKSGFKRTTNWS